MTTSPGNVSIEMSNIDAGRAAPSYSTQNTMLDKPFDPETTAKVVAPGDMVNVVRTHAKDLHRAKVLAVHRDPATGIPVSCDVAIEGGEDGEEREVLKGLEMGRIITTETTMHSRASWWKRNWLTVMLFFLGILGLILALVLALEPCEPKTVKVTRQVEVLVTKEVNVTRQVEVPVTKEVKVTRQVEVPVTKEVNVTKQVVKEVTEYYNVTEVHDVTEYYNETTVTPADFVLLLDGSGSMCMSSTETHTVPPVGGITYAPNNQIHFLPCPVAPDIHFEKQLVAAGSLLEKLKTSLASASSDNFRAAAVQFGPDDVLAQIASGNPQYLVGALTTDIDALKASVAATDLIYANTDFGPALVACANQLATHTGAPANTFRACMLISDGGNTDFNPYGPSTVEGTWCAAQSPPVSPCGALEIATHIKSSGTKIVGIFVGDTANSVTHKEQAEGMYEFADCAASGTYAESNDGADCPHFLDVSFAEFDAKAQALADTLVSNELISRDVKKTVKKVSEQVVKKNVTQQVVEKVETIEKKSMEVVEKVETIEVKSMEVKEEVETIEKQEREVKEEVDSKTTCVKDGNWFWMLLLFLPLAAYLLWRPVSLLTAKYVTGPPPSEVTVAGAQDGLVPPPPPDMTEADEDEVAWRRFNAMGAIDPRTGKRRKAGRKNLDARQRLPGEAEATWRARVNALGPIDPATGKRRKAGKKGFDEYQQMPGEDAAAYKVRVNAMGAIDPITGKRRKAGRKNMDAYQRGSTAAAGAAGGGGAASAALAFGGMSKAAFLEKRRADKRRGHLGSIAARGDIRTRKKKRKAGRKKREFRQELSRGTHKFSVASAGTYLWDFQGGVTPRGMNMGVGLGTPKGLARPRDARGKSVFERPNPRKKQRAGSVFNPKDAAGNPNTYTEKEIQPGDLDYEYVMFLMRCFPCLRPYATPTARRGFFGGRKRTVSVGKDGHEWLSAVDEDGDTYYWNPRTQEARWVLPAGCAEAKPLTKMDSRMVSLARPPKAKPRKSKKREAQVLKSPGGTTVVGKVRTLSTV